MGTGVIYEEVCSTYTSTWCGEATRKFPIFINTARQFTRKTIVELSLN